MDLNHKKVIDELIKKKIIPSDDPFDYSDHPEAELFEHYFQFCQRNLFEEKKFQIRPGRIYIRKRLEVNAAATKAEDYYIIRVNFGTVIALKNLLSQKMSNLENRTLDDFLTLQKNIDYPLWYLMLQFSTQWTFHHEKAHLIQFSPVCKEWLEETNENEDPASEPYCFERHMYEFDADLYASYFIGLDVALYYGFFKRRNPSLPEKSLSLLLSLAVASILTYFILLHHKYFRIYYEASTHPHPAVRASYIYERLITTVYKTALNVDVLNDDIIVHDALRLIDQFFADENQGPLKNFSFLVLEEFENIGKYVEKLGSHIPSMPELILNRGALR